MNATSRALAKVLMLLLFSGGSYLFASGNSEKKMELISAIEQISKKYNLYFTFDVSLVKGIEVDYDNSADLTAEKALSNILQGVNLNYRFFEERYVIIYRNDKEGIKSLRQMLKHIRNLVNENVQQPATGYMIAPDADEILNAAIPIKGVVLGATGERLAGVSVMIKGSAKGTTTDAEGKFTLLNVEEDAVMVFSYTGFMMREMAVLGKSEFNIVLQKDQKAMEAIVVVGYGTQKKVNLTGAVDQIDGKALVNRPVPRLSQALQGMVGNLNVATGTQGGQLNSRQSINIRGYTGFGVTGAPLVVVDGVQIGDINTINPDDIENISVIKDAASAAIYGSNAPYGVILITTKKGGKNKYPTLTYSNNLSVINPIHLPDMINSLDFANIYNETSLNAGGNILFDDETIGRIKAYLAGTMKDETIVNPTQPNRYHWWTKSNANNNWFDIYFKKRSFMQQHNLGLSGGSGNSTYYIGMGYHDRNGMFRFGDENLKRYNLRANFSTEVNKWLNFSLRSSFVREHYDMPNSNNGVLGEGYYMRIIARRWPTVPLYFPDGSGRYTNLSIIPYLTEGGRAINIENQGLLTGELNFRLASNWLLTANYSFSSNATEFSRHSKTLYDYWPDGTVEENGHVPNRFERGQSNNQQQVINVFSSYKYSTNGHNFGGLVGYVKDMLNYQYMGAGNAQLYNNDIPALSLTYSANPFVTDTVRRLNTQGVFGRINYNFQEKYLVEINGRYDGTSRFLKDTRWKFYPGVSAGWVISKENFWGAGISKRIDFLKIRGSYGSLGDQSFLGENYYPFYPALGLTAPANTTWLFGGNRAAAVGAPALIDSRLTWVTTTNLSVGVDAAFLNNRLEGNFDWYVRGGKDFAGPSEALPEVLGAVPPLTNNSRIETRGFELALKWSDNIGKVRYGVRVILSDYKGKVINYPNPNKLLSTWYEGQSIGEIWGYQTVGLFKSDEDAGKAPPQNLIFNGTWTAGDVQYADLNGNNRIDYGNNTAVDPGDRKVIGNSTPRYAYGVTLSADWKGFDIEVFIQGIAKRDAWINSNYFWGMVGDQWSSTPMSVHINNRWTPQTPDGYFPKFYMSAQNNKNTQAQTRYLQDASYLRLKNLQLGYTLPESLTKRIKIQRARIYVSADNLLTLTKLIKTIDPELAIGNASIYPLQRFKSVGINLTF